MSMKKKIKDDSRVNRLEQEINKVTLDKEIETIKKISFYLIKSKLIKKISNINQIILLFALL